MTGFDGARVFVAGPIAGMPDWNRGAFDSCEKLLKELGAERVHNPLREAPVGGMGTSFPPPDFAREEVRELIRTRSAGRGMTRKGNYYGVLALLPGWEDDDAAPVLYTVANNIGMEVELWTMPNLEKKRRG